jgi:GDP-4-dehydro-6-deoxy-D-mannose reductase
MRTFARIVMTGGTGFVGATLAPAIARAFPDAEHWLLRAPGDPGAREGWGVVEAAIDDSAAVDAIIADIKPDLVLHLAAQASVGHSASAAEQTWRVNFNGSLNLGCAVARHCADDVTFLFISSSEIYGDSFLAGPAVETAPPRPSNVYARTKAAAEAMLADVLRDEQRLIVARPFNHTGAGQDRRFALPSFAAQIAEIEAGLRPPRLEVGNLDAERDFLDVADVCRAYEALLRADLPRRATFNIATGAAWRVGDLLQRLAAKSARPFEIVADPARMRASDIPCAIGDCEALRKATGWRPEKTIDDTLEDLLAFWRGRVRQSAP